MNDRCPTESFPEWHKNHKPDEVVLYAQKCQTFIRTQPDTQIVYQAAFAKEKLDNANNRYP